MTTTPMTDRADELRAQLVDGLRNGVRRPPLNLPAPIWEAMLAVPRQEFCPPDTTLEEAYAVAAELADYIAEWGALGMPQRATHVYRAAGSTSPLEGSILQLPGGGSLAVAQHHDRTEEV